MNNQEFSVDVAQQAEQSRLNNLCQFRIDVERQGFSNVVPVFNSLDEVREVRSTLLTQADILINKADDQAQDSSALRQYRQALRDVTKQNIALGEAFNPFPALPSV
ncbi:phage tail assembly chaperone [Pseudoalteromonas tunicata]|jgi:hypothetical protein|uniref:Phage tail assembly chaperone-like domain-containing protein n=1 Tax=Pseudoalteromonas tunicata D2 TaxID=87626 RepID=A4C8U6_9GAMM|nr:phage tail assembly chaperone [Pseudoalteromonas tunicata]ATC93514.1 hypothetical protein PTUN_a0778 [Pseudoalteromonas tunicata]AXT29360.1 hypothetical protein D1819_00015 [Pseudoalteromonas tunicata]EAR29011.1 hypothetical protein PTD2_08204 [Pseudoalteromonas tunicata D2]